MSKITDITSKVMASVNFNNKFRGINLLADGDPCWEGYEQYGTKDMDGREVPNCVPISEPK
jgi:precorrin-6B methylase 1